MRNNQPRLDVSGLIGQEDDVVHFVLTRETLGELDARLLEVPS